MRFDLQCKKARASVRRFGADDDKPALARALVEGWANGSDRRYV